MLPFFKNVKSWKEINKSLIYFVVKRKLECLFDYYFSLFWIWSIYHDLITPSFFKLTHLFSLIFLLIGYSFPLSDFILIFWISFPSPCLQKDISPYKTKKSIKWIFVRILLFEKLLAFSINLYLFCDMI